MRIGVDTGGTFTDLVIWDGGEIRARKLRSTPDDPARAILEGVAGLAADDIVHGSTAATNALLERKGAPTAFITTEGFEDLLEIGRQNRSELYNLSMPPRAALVAPDRCLGAPERILYDGSVERELDAAAVKTLVQRLRGLEVQSVAVCLLHAYANPCHERLLGEALSEFDVSLSHEILPEYREYERASTTVVNAYVMPLMRRYLERLSREVGSAQLRVFQSNGGSISAQAAARKPVHTVLSGPAGGVLGAAAAARSAGFDRFISFDMGGTSTDVSLYDGRFSYTSESRVGDFPVRVPMLDIHTVGAGGGSIAYLDAAGALRVGPRSAGADPGPVCYGKGDQITVTDANLVLGRIDPQRFLGGRMELDAERARSQMQRFADAAGVSAETMAAHIVATANSNMERAIRAVSVERGYDPREFALLSFGGAGAQHACELAARLEISTVIVPPLAGVLSAAGMLTADSVQDYSQSVLGAEPEQAFTKLEARAREEFSAQGFGHLVIERSIDLRYRGQSYELTLPWAERGEFARAHEKAYGYAHQGREVEQVTARLRAAAPLEKLPFESGAGAEGFSSLHVPQGWREKTDSAGNVVLTSAGGAG